MSTLTPDASKLGIFAPAAPPPRSEPAPPTNRVVLDGVAWGQYLAVADAFPDRPGLRVTFDRGRLEIMTRSPEHEIRKRWLGRLVELMLEEAGLPWVTAGQMTFRREDMERGFEPDDCFWIAHEPRMRGRLDFDAANDPPPDLMLEVEVSRSALGRLGIYAALRVPEVWRLDGTDLFIHSLQPDGTYREVAASVALPWLTPAGLAPFLSPDATRDNLAFARTFRAWVRAQLPAAQEDRP